MFKKSQHIESSLSVTGVFSAYSLVGYKKHCLKRAGAKIPGLINSDSTTAELLFFNSTYKIWR